ncbi:MAG: hypothetical protein GKR95_16650 [Gammaproteobacteria bacterium]|nr:hypothetical protein [Gammaproteobacteria bacterium]
MEVLSYQKFYTVFKSYLVDLTGLNDIEARTRLIEDLRFNTQSLRALALKLEELFSDYGVVADPNDMPRLGQNSTDEIARVLHVARYAVLSSRRNQ